MEKFSWTCPFCRRDTTITQWDVDEKDLYLELENRDGERTLNFRFIVCPNPECKKFTLLATLFSTYTTKRGVMQRKAHVLNKWQLIPSPKGKEFPDYIPKALLEDYNEACLIKDLSPKASATLARRCLQGIIRDFWQVKVKSGKLADEIDEIKDKVDTTTWQAIDAVRSVANIGAHMEKDVNLIVDIEPSEAELLIGLIEIIFKDWYIARQTKKEQLEAIIKLAEEKETARKPKQNNT